MNFHIFTCILHLLRVYYELTKWPAPSWLDSSVGIALHRYRRSHRSESRSGLNYFTTAQVVFITAMINHIFISFSAVQIYEFSYTHLYSLPFTGILRTYKVASSQWLDNSVGRALHRYCRGHGFESRLGPNFFQALISQLLCA